MDVIDVPIVPPAKMLEIIFNALVFSYPYSLFLELTVLSTLLFAIAKVTVPAPLEIVVATDNPKTVSRLDFMPPYHQPFSNQMKSIYFIISTFNA